MVVEFKDTYGDVHNALVKKIHGDPDLEPAICLIYVDPNGIVVEANSVVHLADNTANCNCWSFLD